MSDLGAASFSKIATHEGHEGHEDHEGPICVKGVKSQASYWELAHQREASWDQDPRHRAWHHDHRPHASSRRGRRLADAPGKQDAEAPEAREADAHAHVSHRMLPRREQPPGEFDARGLAELMRGLTEDRFKLSNQMKGRNTNFLREISNREWRLALLEQQIAGPAQASEAFVSQEHDVVYPGTH